MERHVMSGTAMVARNSGAGQPSPGRPRLVDEELADQLLGRSRVLPRSDARMLQFSSVRTGEGASAGHSVMARRLMLSRPSQRGRSVAAYTLG